MSNTEIRLLIFENIYFQQGFVPVILLFSHFFPFIQQRIRANAIDRMDLVGDVNGADCIIVDDMIDTAGTLCKAASELKSRGANRIYAFATHGIPPQTYYLRHFLYFIFQLPFVSCSALLLFFHLSCLE